jgi:ADP-ribosylglycohydrolase
MKTASRARGALYGLAIGDALGMPTQMLSRRHGHGF